MALTSAVTSPTRTRTRTRTRTSPTAGTSVCLKKSEKFEQGPMQLLGLYLTLIKIVHSTSGFGGITLNIFDDTGCTGSSRTITTWEGVCIPYGGTTAPRKTWALGQVQCRPNQQQTMAILLFKSGEGKCTGDSIRLEATTTACIDVTSPSGDKISFQVTDISCAKDRNFDPNNGIDRPYLAQYYNDASCAEIVESNVLNIIPPSPNPSPSATPTFVPCSNFASRQWALELNPPDNTFIADGRLWAAASASPPATPPTSQCAREGGVSKEVMLPSREKRKANPSATSTCQPIPTIISGSVRISELAVYIPPGAGAVPDEVLESWAVGLIVVLILVISLVGTYYLNKWGYCNCKAAPMTAPVKPGVPRPGAPGLPQGVSLQQMRAGTGAGQPVGVATRPQAGQPVGVATRPQAGQPVGVATRPPGAPLPNPLNVTHSSSPGVSDWAAKTVGPPKRV